MQSAEQRENQQSEERQEKYPPKLIKFISTSHITWTHECKAKRCDY
jgi:hypothetical protein